ncbi:hypothetical protein HHI36_005853 [Cryptolaemus montrouzieri]|uniref:BEN domain-containing protein n=1 Tax=Cryptolaemus montrouzieri TaxID=559131 RepID=A0ABD2NVK5_9CUCU
MKFAIKSFRISISPICNFNSTLTVIIIDSELWVLLGAGCTTVPRREYEKFDFRRMKYTIAVRRLLNLKFTKEELATHSQTAKESPAFIGVKARKPQLDPVRVGDIRLHVAQKYNIDISLVNKAITVALADARKTKKRKIEKEDTD